MKWQQEETSFKKVSILSSAAFSSTSETDARPDTPVQRFYLLETFPIRVEIHFHQSGNTFHKRGFCRQIPASGKSHQGSDIRNGGGKEMQRKLQKRPMPNVREDTQWSSYQIFHFMQYFSPVAVEWSGFGSTLVNWGQIWSHQLPPLCLYRMNHRR